MVLLGVTVVAVLLALWGWRATSDGTAEVSTAGGQSATFRVPGGTVSLTAVSPEVMSHPSGMPASMMPDPTPAGFRRVTLDVTLRGTGDGLRFAEDRFRLSGPGVAAVAPRRGGLGSGVVPSGSTLSGSLLFQVPESARTLSLTMSGAEQSVAVTLPPASPGEHGGEGAPGAGATPGTGTPSSSPSGGEHAH